MGPLTVHAGEGAVVRVGGRRQRNVLAALLMARNRVVSVDSLIDVVWPGGAPATARNQIAICVAGLRKAFSEQAGVTDLITTAHPGYILNSRGHYIDASDFEERVQQARDQVRAGQTAVACELINDALSLWRGPAFDGLDAERLMEEAERLASVRLSAYEDYAELQLKLGRHRTLIPELAAHVHEYPLREQARAHLVLAHYRAGRRADALAVFREGRELMVRELGIEPGPALQALHKLVLQDSPTLTPPQTNPAPAQQAGIPTQLPVQSASFTGRADVLRRLDRMLDEQLGHSPLSVGVISGVSGVGKTALAVHWANQVVSCFPDGQFYVDLRGFHEEEPASASAVLDQFLRGLGVQTAQIPADTGERAALYRSLLGGRRVLIILDNARDAEQVRPLLPGNGRCCVLITSRQPMTDLLGDYAVIQVPLQVMSPSEAESLLAEIAGAERIAVHPEATTHLAALCDRLPLALRIAGARLAAKPYWSVPDLVRRLRNQRRRLDELSLGDRGIRAGFRLSYRELSPLARRLYRLVGLQPMPTFAGWVASSLLASDSDRAEVLIEELLEAQLLEVASIDAVLGVRYRCPDLLRVFAWERACDEESEEERAAALKRVHAAYLQLADAAHQREYGGDGPFEYGAPLLRPLQKGLVESLVKDPLAWLESERTALIGVIGQAAAADDSAAAWGLTVNASTLFEAHNYLEDWRSCATASLAAAERTGDLRGRATMLRSMGMLAIYQRQYKEAASWLDRSLPLFESMEAPHGLALTLRNLALCRRFSGDLAEAGRLTRRSLAGFRTAGDLAGESHALGLLAQIELESGNVVEGATLSTDAIAKSRAAGSHRGEAQNSYRLAEALMLQGDYLAAEQVCFEALALIDSDSDRLGEGHVLRGIGEARWRRGAPSAALLVLQQSLEAAEVVTDGYLGARARTDLACARLLLGSGDTVEMLETAREAFAGLGAHAWEERAARLLRLAQRLQTEPDMDPPTPQELARTVDG
ncbi:BTAD domain-containing putative transcriptional regulator [Streptomyces sp. NPDC059832]|uniref:AfsR/SARP family transcriptional regulator n=1 Tax=Streptomyces sp. NPDC059832 TaxID=3346966 RepID=UPI003662E350